MSKGTLDPMSDMAELDSMASIFWFSPSEPLNTFLEMWLHVLQWAVYSSLLVHTIAALIAFMTLRKHRVGRYLVGVFVIGLVTNALSGLVTSAVIAFVYRASALEMTPFYGFLYGVGQTVMAACFSFTRILATL